MDQDEIRDAALLAATLAAERSRGIELSDVVEATRTVEVKRLKLIEDAELAENNPPAALYGNVE